jgi:GDP-mannose pyrophosphatase NudK
VHVICFHLPKNKMARVKINDAKVLSDEHYVLKQYDYELQKRDGEWENQTREVFDHGNAVSALLYNKEHKTVILTKQFRFATYVNGNKDGMLIEACAGLLDKANESPEEAIKREIKEETGYEVTYVQKAGQAYTSAGSLTELIYLYVAAYTKEQQVSEGGGLAKEGEDVEVMEIPFEQAIKMLENGEIQDAKTIMLLQYAQLKGLV